MSAARELFPQYQSKDLSPTKAAYRKRERKGENSRSQKGSEQLRPIKSIDPALETRQSHTIEYRVGKIVPQRKIQ